MKTKRLEVCEDVKIAMEKLLEYIEMMDSVNNLPYDLINHKYLSKMNRDVFNNCKLLQNKFSEEYVGYEIDLYYNGNRIGIITIFSHDEIGVSETGAIVYGFRNGEYTGRIAT